MCSCIACNSNISTCIIIYNFSSEDASILSFVFRITIPVLEFLSKFMVYLRIYRESCLEFLRLNNPWFVVEDYPWL